jgi:regulator of protease activity HflC (stomatin/prohibitin superfamily)
LLFIILTIVLAIAFVVSIGFAFITAGGKIAAGAVLMLWLIVFGASSATTVSARSVGIQTGFGKYQKTLDNGFHWTNPTSSVEEFSTQIQTLKLDGGEKNAPRVNVTYKGGGQGSIAATVSWKISDKEAKALWERYKSFERVRDELVQASAEGAVRDATNKYIPTDAQAKGNEIAATVKDQIGRAHV